MPTSYSPENILDDILQKGSIDVSNLMNYLTNETQSSYGYFFEVEGIDDFVCRFSTDATRFIPGKTYTFSEVPREHYTIDVKDTIVALIALQVQDDSLMERFHNTLAVAIHFTRTQKSDLYFFVYLANQIISFLNRIVDDVEVIVPAIKKENEAIIDALDIVGTASGLLDDVRDYAMLSMGRFQVREKTVNIQDLVKEAVVISTTGSRFNVDFTQGVPKEVTIDNERLTKIIVNILSKLPSGSTNKSLHIDVNPFTVAEGFMIFTLKSDLPDNLETILTSKYVNPTTLSWFLVQKLCDRFNGYVRIIDETTLRFGIRFKYSAKDNLLQNKRVILFITQRQQRDQVYNVLSQLGCTLTVFNEQDMNLYLGTLNRYDLAVMDEEMAQKYLRRLKAYNTPTLGIANNNLMDFDHVIPSITERDGRAVVEAYRNIIEARQ